MLKVRLPTAEEAEEGSVVDAWPRLENSRPEDVESNALEVPPSEGEAVEDDSEEGFIFKVGS